MLVDYRVILHARVGQKHNLPLQWDKRALFGHHKFWLAVVLFALISF